MKGPHLILSPGVAALLLASLSATAARGQSPLLSRLTLPDAPSSSSVWTSQSQDAAKPQPSAETDAQRRERIRKQSADQVAAEEKQRIAGVVPDFNVVLGGYAPPISPAQKFSLVFHSSIDPFTISLAAVLGGYDEISGSHNGYGWGPAGYFKRFGAQYADTVDGAFWGNAVLPILLHQDPRYFRKGTGSIKSRILHSALSTVICHGDNGHSQFSISNIAGNIISGGISNLYYPSNERGIGLAFDNALQVTAEGAFGAQLLEFSPDLVALYHRHQQRVQDKKAAAAAAQP
ncbi:hypothetical protein [Granulicella tundricola]|uniref:Lipoprotein n=1 Tax=Granulicella tundricola (strain ATCC BAA-1859 / DSM 23138 / MP5ACTX9) TaxID=1198114 RepID=E8WZP8_GRATM|nr:hypothetical protein [Granulicella tundricola]ADW70022.1 hypothetical protein AciX9_2999 [Granulicella tundricola MP5ACTX9]